MFEIVARINTVEGIITPCVREDFSRYRKFVSTCECEICHQNRKRDSLVVIREEDGTEKVAGLDCLRKLYGKETVSKASKFADESEANMKMFDVNVEYFVNVAEDIQRLRGFTSKTEAKESAGRLVANADLLETWEPLPVSTEYTKIKAYFDSLEPTTDFIFSAKNLLSMEWATKRAISMIPAIVNAYHRHLEDEARKRLLSETSKAYGNVGDKFNGSLKVTLVGKFTAKGQGFSYYDNGERTVYVFKTENDELLSWKDSKGYQDLDVEIGDTVVLKSFRVKNQYVSKAYGNVSSVTYLKME